MLYNLPLVTQHFAIFELAWKTIRHFKWFRGPTRKCLGKPNLRHSKFRPIPTRPYGQFATPAHAGERGCLPHRTLFTLCPNKKRAKKVQTATRALPVRRHLIPNPETSRVQINPQLPLNRRNRCNHVGRDLQKRSLDFCRSPTLAATPIPGSVQQALMFFFL